MDLILNCLKFLGASIVVGLTILAITIIAGMLLVIIKNFLRELKK